MLRKGVVSSIDKLPVPAPRVSRGLVLQCVPLEGSDRTRAGSAVEPQPLAPVQRGRDRGDRMKQITGLLVLSLAVASWAPAGTTGRLIGTVRNGPGQPLPGARVTVGSPTEIGGAKTVLTDADGSFQFPSLSPGYYTVKIELSGFVDQERNEVRVRLDRATELNVMMPVAQFSDEVTVVAETPMVDPTQVSTSQNYAPAFLKGVAVTRDRRDYLSVLGMAPGVSLWTSGDPLVYGSSLGENVYMIDSLNTTDPTSAGRGTDLAFDAIQEISFQTGGFEAEYGNAIGGVVNVVTKSGGNELSGSLDVRYYDTSFYQNGDHFDRDTNPVTFLAPAATLGGPILRDRLWFFAAYEQTDSANDAGALAHHLQAQGRQLSRQADLAGVAELAPDGQVVRHSDRHRQ